MANRLKNIAKLFGDSKARTIIIVTLMIVVFGLVIGFVRYKKNVGGTTASTQVEGIPVGLKAIPGQQRQNIEYAKLQERENQLKVKRAFEQGTSALPTLIETSANKNQQGREPQSEPQNIHALALAAVKQSACSIESLQNAKRAGVSATELRQLGCSSDQLKSAGYDAPNLLKAGFSLQDLKRLGYGLDALRGAGVCTCDLKHAGYSAIQLKQAGFNAADLKCACFSDEELRQAGFVPGQTTSNLPKSNCDPERLIQARAQGASPSELRNLGCSASQLQQVGLSASELRQAGFSPDELKAAGFSAGELLAAGFSPESLKQVGFSARDMRAAGLSTAELRDAGYGIQELKQAGFTPSELKSGGFSEQEIGQAGFTEQALQAAGIGVKQDQVKLNDCSVVSLVKARRAGMSANELRQGSGCDANALKQAGFSLQELKAVGFTAGELKKAGFTAADLKKAGFSAADLKDAGFSALELKDAGFTAAELKQAGFSAGALKNAGFTSSALKDAGFSAGELRRAGFSAAEVKQAGFTPAAMRDAGFTAKQLKEAGLDANALQAAGFSEQDIQGAGFNAAARPSTATSPSNIAATNDFLAGINVPGVADGDARFAAIAAQQQQQYTEQQLKQSQQEIQANMQGQAQQLFGKWTAVSNQTLVAGNDETSDIPSGSATREGNTLGGVNANNQAAIMAKAGTVMFAVLDTAVNSDEQGPVMATIVEGEFKGGKLLGSLDVFGRDADRVRLTFNKLILPTMPQSISVNALAIDPNTARTALSSHTDHHYLLRYGSLFASSFLQGYGQAVMQSGSVIIDRDDGSSRKETSTLGSRQLAAAGLGQVGATWGSQLAPIFSRPNTIHVYAGTSVGILFQDEVRGQ
jgi:intracellular multiplication protein IcmE